MSRIKEPTTFKWRIEGFPQRANRNIVAYLQSDNFKLNGSNIECWLEFRLTGPVDEMKSILRGGNITTAYSSIAIGSNAFKHGLADTLDFSFWIANNHNDRLKCASTTVERLDDTRQIVRRFVRHDVIYSSGTFFTNDIVYICCEVRPKKIVVEEKEPPPAHYYDFHEKLAELHGQGVTGNATIHVGEKTFTVEKIFLIAHSQVFERMLQSNMKEAITGEINITDVREEIMEQFVHYLYALRVRDMEKYAEDLYVLSDKYEVTGLKEECAEHLMSNLNRDNITSRFFLAFIHGHSKLQETVLDYLTAPNSDLDFPAILASEEWKQFYVKDPNLANEVMKSVFGKARLTRET